RDQREKNKKTERSQSSDHDQDRVAAAEDSCIGTEKTPAAFMLRSTMPRPPVRLLLSLALLFSAIRAASAIEVKVSAQALERTLQAQLFNGPQGRYYLRGDANSACYVYAESPHVTFVQDR